MKTTCKKIDRWLEEFAPKIYKYSLNKPATLEEIETFQKRNKVSLPDDFKELYLWHNGLNDTRNVGNLFYGMDFFSLEFMEEAIVQRKILEVDLHPEPLLHYDPEIDPSNVCNPNWVLFGTDHSHVDLFVDLSPSSVGSYGQIIAIDDEYRVGFLVARTTSQLLEEFLHDLEDDLYYLDAVALEDDENHFLETEDEIDLVNWQDSDRWDRGWAE